MTPQFISKLLILYKVLESLEFVAPPWNPEVRVLLQLSPETTASLPLTNFRVKWFSME